MKMSSDMKIIDNDKLKINTILSGISNIGKNINNLSIQDENSLSYILNLITQSICTQINNSQILLCIYNDEYPCHQFKFLHTNLIVDPTDTDGQKVNVQYLLPPVAAAEELFRNKKPFFSYSNQIPQLKDHYSKTGIKEYAFFPLLVNGELEGYLLVYLYEKRVISEVEQLILEILLSQAAFAVQNARVQKSISKDSLQKESELNSLHRAGMIISSRLKLEQTLESILELALEMTNAHYGIFRLLDQSNQNLVARAFVGDDMTKPKLEILPINSQSVMAQVAKTQLSILIENLQSEEWSDRKSVV